MKIYQADLFLSFCQFSRRLEWISTNSEQVNFVMSLVVRNYLQIISWWAAGGKDVYGAPTWSGPRELYGLWEDKETLTLYVEGREIVSKTSVHLQDDVSIGDFLYLGSAPSGSSDPTTLSGAWEIKAFNKIPSLLDSTKFDRVAMLG